VADRMDRQASQRIERYRTENEKLEGELAAMRQVVKAAQTQNGELRGDLEEAVRASKRALLARG